MRIPLVLDRSLPGPLTVHAVASDYEATYGPRSYDDIDTTITIAAGQLLGYIDVTVHGDTFDDVDAQYVYVDLTELTGGATFPSGFTDAYAFSYGLIYDDDEPGPGQVRFASFGSSASEGDDTAGIMVVREGGWTGATSVDVAITGGTAIQESDYEATPTQTVSWADGEAGARVVEIRCSTMTSRTARRRSPSPSRSTPAAPRRSRPRRRSSRSTTTSSPSHRSPTRGRTRVATRVTTSPSTAPSRTRRPSSSGPPRRDRTSTPMLSAISGPVGPDHDGVLYR